MQVQRITTLRQFDALRSDWNRLADTVPFRKWEWLRAWWVHFRQRHQLFVLVVRDDNQQTIGIAPWFLEKSFSSGRLVRFLGSGKVCSDYLSLLCEQSDQDGVAQAIAMWLIEAHSSGSQRSVDGEWELLRLTGIEIGDPAIERLKHHLAELGAAVYERPSTSCWRIAIPETWDEYLAARPRPYRRKIRRLKEKMLDNGRACGRLVIERREVHRLFETLVELHQRRRESLHQRGCFKTPAFHDFLFDVVDQFCETEHLYFAELTIDGQTAAASVGLIFDNVNYIYQCGMSPELSRCQPSWLMNTYTVQHAIRNQLCGVDFLCGDEPYKAHLGARPVRMVQVRVAAPRPLASLRHQLWLGGERLKHWLHPTTR